MQIIQSRSNEGISFNKTWLEYKNGFGSLNSDFWLGNTYIERLTSIRPHRLFVILHQIKSLEKLIANYAMFKIRQEKEYFRMDLGTFEGGSAGELPKVFPSKPRDVCMHSLNVFISNYLYCRGQHL